MLFFLPGLHWFEGYGSRIHFYEPSVNCLIAWPAVGRGLKLEDVASESFCCVLNWKALGGSSVETPRYILIIPVLRT